MGLLIKHPTGVILELVHDSLINQDVAVAVNAANTEMRGGGGIDGIIHQMAGPKLLQELEEVAPDGCPTGGAVITRGYFSCFDALIHAVGPIWKGGDHNEHKDLVTCYLSSLALASANGHKSIGFCSISTGIYKFPLQEAVPTALGAVCCWLRKTNVDHPIDRVVFAMYGEEEYNAYYLALRTLQANWS